MTVTVLNTMARSFLEGRMPDWVEPRWFNDSDELRALAPEAEIGWFDNMELYENIGELVQSAGKLRWLTTISAGVEIFPLEALREKCVVLTNGAGLNAITIAEYAVMGMLVIAKGYREVARSQDRHEWLPDAPGKQELSGSRLLIVGAGGIGGRVARLLSTWEVEITEVRRKPAPGALTPDQWRSRLGEFDWVLVAVPSTPETSGMFGAAEFAAMKQGANILNFARGAVIDQESLMDSLRADHLGGAFLDVTEPEPLPADHPLWTFDNVHITSHLSGRSQENLFRRSAERFVANLERYGRGEPLEAVVDLSSGY
jgi:phosphoglycerate dehydrogenase-like enzyme